MSDFLTINGIRIPIDARASTEIDYQEVGGEVVRAYFGNLLSSVKGHARVWKVVTPAQKEFDSLYLLGMLRAAYAVPCDGKFTGGPTLAFVRALRRRVVAAGGGPRWVLEFELHESGPLAFDGGLLRNPNFELGGDWWGVPLSTSWLGPGAGAEVAITDGGEVGKTVNVIPQTPIIDFGLTPGMLVSGACGAMAEPGAIADLRFVWRDAGGGALRFDVLDGYTSAAWGRRALDARQVPAGAVTVSMYYRGRGTGTARFRNATFGSGSSAPPYLTAAVMHDPARAHGGSRYLEAMQPSGQALIHQRDASGATRYFKVSPGDVVKYGLWCQRLSGDGRARARLTAMDVERGDPNYLSTSDVSSPGWTLSSGSYTIPADKAYVYLSCQIVGATTPTTARFGSVYLRIRPAGA